MRSLNREIIPSVAVKDLAIRISVTWIEKRGTEDRGNLAVIVPRAIFEKDSSLPQQPLETSSIFPISNSQGGTKIPPLTIP